MQSRLDPSDSLILKVCCELEIDRGERGAEVDPEKVIERVDTDREQAVESMQLLNDEGLIKAIYTNSTVPYLLTVTDEGFDAYGHAYIPDYDSLVRSVGRRIVEQNEHDSVEIADALNERLVAVEHILGLFEARGFIEIFYETGPSLEISKVSPRLGRWLQTYDFDGPPLTPDEFSEVTQVGETPVEIQESLERFKEDHPDPATTAFILMQFGQTKAHEEITAAVKEGLAAHGITGVRADDKEYHEDLFPNVLTYMHGCGLGIAVFERIEAERFNPNVALEVGYMFAMRKPVCLLKDHTLSTLHADLVGKLFREFDTQNPGETIPPVVSKWLLDKGFERVNTEATNELEAAEAHSAQDALERYFDRMEQWITDERNPLATLPHDHPRRKMAATRTREILRRLNSQQKRDVLVFLYEHGLIKKNGLRIVGLRDADFSGADFTRLQLWEANLDGVNLSEADLSHAQFSAGHGHSASMQEAVAMGSSDLLEDGMIPDRPSSLSGANLSGAVLRRTRLGGCDLITANFDGADLTEADLRAADLQLARNLAQEQIESAFGSSGGQEYMPDTLLPDHLTAPDAWKKLLSQQIIDRGY